MHLREAKLLLGIAGDCVPSQSEVKSAYRKLVWGTHPDRFPSEQKAMAEHKFKSISEAYYLLSSEGRRMRIFVPEMAAIVGRGGRRWRFVGASSIPFLFIVLAAISLGGSTAKRAYTRQKEANPSYNPFLP
ncbi:hypothetical protein M569_08165 [Genlisea aurea]|uniref:J domain-containing protein n=1 Tax=Genlisea aurea TaxID=192259 RepID=S8DTW5_9LAMI|nr:hypothetical protein M569_08165 [Genlisea aurea]